MMVRLRGMIWRSLRASRRRAALTILGTAIGMALVVAVLSLGAMAQAGVERQIAEQFGGVDLMIGSGRGEVALTDADVARIRSTAGVRRVGTVFLPFLEHPFEAEQTIRYVGLSPDPGVLTVFRLPAPVGPGEVFLSRDLADHLQAAPGQPVTLPFPDRPRTFTVGRVVEIPMRAGAPYVAFFAAEDLQAALGRQGEVTAAYIHLAHPSLKERVAWEIQKDLAEQNPAVAEALQVDMVLEADEMRQSLGGLRNLGLAVGALSLLVSLLAVLGITQFDLRERLQEIAVLRALGASRGQAMRVLLGEVLLLGGAGALLGGVLGVLLALGTGRLVASWLGIPVALAMPPVGQLAVALVAGWALQAVGVWLPIRQAARVPPVMAARQAETDERVGRPRRWPPALALGAAAALVLIGRRLPPGDGEAMQLLLSVVAALLVAGAAFALSGAILAGVLLPLRPVLIRRGQELLLALRNVLALQRQARLTTVVLGSALAVASVAFTFLQTSVTQRAEALRLQFPTDLVVASRRENASTIPWERGAEVGQLPGVDGAAALGVSFGMAWENADEFPVDPAFRSFWTREGKLGLNFRPADFRGLGALGLIDPAVAAQPGAVIISREMARQTGWEVGDALHFARMGDPRFADITAARVTLRVGQILPEPVAGLWEMDILVDMESVPLRAERRLLYKVLVEVQPGQEQAVEQGLLALQSRVPELAWSTEEQARAELQERTGQSFAILGTSVGVLSLLGLLSTVNTLIAGLFARRREHATLRAAGLSAGQLVRLVLAENLLFAAGAVLTGLVAGLGFIYMAVVAIGGWRLYVPWGVLGAIAGVAVVVTVLVSAAASRRLATGRILEALRQE